MSEIFRFETWAGSGRDLIAACSFFDNVLTLREHIAAIGYQIIDVGSYTPPDTPDPLSTGSVPLTAMMTAPVLWDRDPRGYTFIWGVPGHLIAKPDHTYRIIITFTTTAAYDSKPFILVWEVFTKNPAT